MRLAVFSRRMFNTAANAAKEDINALIESDIKQYPVMVYMKGTPDQPQCGFSRRAVQLLQAAGVEFASRDVLQDLELREGVKKFTKWPTLPQVFIGGEFVGGSDTLFEMFKNGELDTMLDSKGVKRLPESKH